MSEAFLVVGGGSMGRRRIRHLRELSSGARILCLDVRADRRDEIGRLFEGVATAPDAGALDGVDLSAVFVCIPPAYHEGWLDWAIGRGLPFFVEQPVSHRLDRLAWLRDEVRARRLVVHVGDNHRHSARVRTIREILDSGRIGRPLTGLVEIGEWLPDWHPYEPYTDYYPSRRALGGGLDAVCDLDWLRYLLGDVVEGLALAGTTSDLDIDTPDVAQFLLRFEGGARLVLHTDMLQRPYTAQVKLVGTEGTLRHRMPEPAVEVYRRATGAWEQVPIADESGRFASMQGKTAFEFVEPMYWHETRSFLERLRTGDADPRSLDEGIANLTIVHRLLATGRWPS